MERSCIYEHWHVKSLNMPASTFLWNMNMLINHSSQTTLVLYVTFGTICSNVSKTLIQPVKCTTLRNSLAAYMSLLPDFYM